METLYLDTHIVVWLRQKELEKFTPKAIELIENSSKLLISPMVVLELEYLYEIGKIIDDPKNIVDDLSNMIDLQVDNIEFHTIIKKAKDIKWTRDAFDRIIVANSLVRVSKLLTKDRNILKHFKHAVF